MNNTVHDAPNLRDLDTSDLSHTFVIGLTFSPDTSKPKSTDLHPEAAGIPDSLSQLNISLSSLSLTPRAPALTFGGGSGGLFTRFSPTPLRRIRLMDDKSAPGQWGRWNRVAPYGASGGGSKKHLSVSKVGVLESSDALARLRISKRRSGRWWRNGGAESGKEGRWKEMVTLGPFGSDSTVWEGLEGLSLYAREDEGPSITITDVTPEDEACKLGSMRGRASSVPNLSTSSTLLTLDDSEINSTTSITQPLFSDSDTETDLPLQLPNAIADSPRRSLTLPTDPGTFITPFHRQAPASFLARRRKCVRAGWGPEMSPSNCPTDIEWPSTSRALVHRRKKDRHVHRPSKSLPYHDPFSHPHQPRAEVQRPEDLDAGTPLIQLLRHRRSLQERYARESQPYDSLKSLVEEGRSSMATLVEDDIPPPPYSALVRDEDAVFGIRLMLNPRHWCPSESFPASSSVTEIDEEFQKRQTREVRPVPPRQICGTVDAFKKTPEFQILDDGIVTPPIGAAGDEESLVNLLRDRLTVSEEVQSPVSPGKPFWAMPYIT
ncbi:hypothetical protein HDU67_004627 [Dinochytrium kinnereticum]|nr:hypothetical protein HDU67_004627 [Dinochytrium kinnereticum]